MHEQPDLLEQVVAALEARKGDLQSVAKATGVPYDTVLRIKNRENDPGYSKVAVLAAFLLPKAENSKAA
jgi:hypothetical protein